MLFPSDNNFEYITRLKIILYCEGTVNDIETQRKGMVYIMWFELNDFEGLSWTAEKMREQQRERSRWQPSEVGSLRPSAIHFCSPNTPFFRFVSSVWTLSILSRWRTRFQIHS